MQNEILPRHDVYVSLTKLIDELFPFDPASCYPSDFSLYWLVHKLDSDKNAFSSKRTKENPGNYISWNFSKTAKNIC